MTECDGVGRGVRAQRRRGMLAGAAALAAGLLAKLGVPERAEAAHGNPPAGAAAGLDTIALHIGASNTQSNGTITTLNGATGFSLVSIRNSSSSGGGLSASGSTSSLSGGFGVRGICGDSALSSQPPHVGVHGMDLQHGEGVGVRGDGTSVGVLGRSSFAGGQLRDTVGVRGESGAGQGIYGVATGGTGVYGTSTSGVGTIGISRDAAGVYGFSTNGPGVYAVSAANPSVFAESTRTAVWGRSGAGAGVFGQATSNGIGVYGAAGAGGWAGYFEGNVYVTGRVTQAGAAASTALAADGSQRALYSVDSAEPLVEDVGEADLVGGKVEVALDPDFAALTEGGAYHVFLTPRGECNGLYAPRQTPAGFEVRELRAGTASLPFSYRVVAKRKGATGKRLERLERPRGLSASELEPPKLPQAPTRDPESPPSGPRPPVAR